MHEQLTPTFSYWLFMPKMGFLGCFSGWSSTVRLPFIFNNYLFIYWLGYHAASNLERARKLQEPFYGMPYVCDTPLVTPCFPLMCFITFPFFHIPPFFSSPTMSTISPKSGTFDLRFCILCDSIKLCIYSFLQRVHTWSRAGRLYIGRRNESARADRRVMRKKTGASTILKEIEENRDFELFSSSGHFSQSFWC